MLSAQVKFLLVLLSVSKMGLSGEALFFEKKFLNISSFLGLLYVLRHFKQKKIFFQKIFSPIYLI